MPQGGRLFSLFASPGGASRVMCKNFASLNLLNVLNHIVPLLTVPYLTRTLGADNFGLFNLALAFASYFLVVTDYGFSITATKEISERGRGGDDAVATIFGEVVGAKALLAFFSFALYAAAVFGYDGFRAEAALYLLSFSVVLGNVLFPLWFFQGLQRMEYIAFINAATRALYVALIFLLVREPDDYIALAWINLANILLAGAAGLYAARRLMPAFRPPNLAAIWRRLKAGFFAFPPSVALGLYSCSSLFIIGLVCGNEAAGHYSGAYKLISVVISISGVLGAVIFPHINALASISKPEAVNFIRKAAIAASLVLLPLSGALAYYAEEVVLLLLGRDFAPAAGIISVLAFLPLVSMVNNFVSTQAVMALGLKNYFSKIYTIAPCAGLLALLPVIQACGPAGAAWVAVLVEAAMLAASLAYLRLRGVKFFSPTAGH